MPKAERRDIPKSAQVISWEDAAERIGQLMDEGKYATNVELAEAELHERTELSHKLWYIRGDLSDEAREHNVLGTLQDYRRGGFPDATARLAEDLKDLLSEKRCLPITPLLWMPTKQTVM